MSAFGNAASAQARMENERQEAWDEFQEKIKPLNETAEALRAKYDKEMEPLRDKHGQFYSEYAKKFEEIGAKYAEEIETENSELSEQDIADLDSLATAPDGVGHE